MLKRLLAKPVEKAEVDRLVSLELAAILAVCTPISIFLFGSAARETMTTASDLDLLVVMRDCADLKQIKKQYYCRRPAIDWPVDIIFMHQLDFDRKSLLGGVPMICRQEGKVIYGGATK